MKIKRRTIVVAIAVACFIIWKFWHWETPAQKTAYHQKVERLSTQTPDASKPVTANSAPSSFPASLLTDTAEQLAEFTRLRALPDDIETFRKSAEIENEFNNSLDPAEAAFLIKNMPNSFTDSYLGGLCLHKWASAQRLEAAQWMQSHPSDQPTTAQALAAGWLAADRTSLKDYLDCLPTGNWKNNLATSASEEAYLAKEPSTVIDLLAKTSGPSERRNQLYEWNTTAWAMKDHAAALRWVEEGAPPIQRQTLLAAIAIGRSHTEPDVSANWLLNTVSDPATVKSAMHAIVRIWATKDQAAALHWVESLPSGPLRDDSADGLIAILKPENNTD